MDYDDDYGGHDDEEEGRLEGIAGDVAAARAPARGGSGTMDEEAQEFDISEADNKLWLVKLPGFLMEAWSEIEQDGVDLGVLRIYKKPDARGHQRIKLLLPENSTNLPREYDLNVNDPAVRNTYTFQETSVATERPPEPTAAAQSQPTNRAPAPLITRSTRLKGTVHHECSVHPTMNDAYRAILRRRQAAASAPRRTTQMLKIGEAEASAFSNRGGSATIGKFSFGFIDAKAKGRKNLNDRGEREVAVRIPKNELLDKLFALFVQYEYWNMKMLRQKLVQPEQYLKEVLGEIAILHKRGEYTNHWGLKPEYRTRPSVHGGTINDDGVAQARVKTEDTPVQSGGDDNDDDDDDDDDYDMEEVP